MNEPKFRVPGFLWTALLALIPLIITWLQGDYFGGQTWVAIAIIVLGAVLKLVELQVRAEPALRHVTGSRSQFNRFLLG